MARDEKIVIRLTEEVKTDFQKMADDLGMTISALGSYVIGRYVKEEKKREMLQEQMIHPTIDKIMEHVVTTMDRKDMAKVLNQVTNHITKE